MRRRLLVLALVFVVTYAVANVFAPPPPSQIAALEPGPAPADASTSVQVRQSGAAHAPGSSGDFAFMIAAIATFLFGTGWIAWSAVRAGPWPPGSRRAREATYGAATFAAFHSPVPHGSECGPSYDGFGGGADCGGVGV